MEVVCDATSLIVDELVAGGPVVGLIDGAASFGGLTLGAVASTVADSWSVASWPVLPDCAEVPSFFFDFCSVALDSLDAADSPSPESIVDSLESVRAEVVSLVFVPSEVFFPSDADVPVVEELVDD